MFLLYLTFFFTAFYLLTVNEEKYHKMFKLFYLSTDFGADFIDSKLHQLSIPTAFPRR